MKRISALKLQRDFNVMLHEAACRRLVDVVNVRRAREVLREVDALMKAVIQSHVGY